MKSGNWTDKRLVEALSLYGITDRMWLPRPFQPGDELGARQLARDVEDCIAGGVSMIQLREKNVTHGQFLQIGRAAAAVCRKHGVPFIVDDDVDAAIELGADGIHVGQSDLTAEKVRSRVGPGMILGVSAQTPEQAVRAQAAGADYLGTGAVFATSTKQDADGVSREQLIAVCSAVTIPVVAIGGINTGNIRRLEGSGIAGVSVVSALFAAPDKKAAAEKLASFSRQLTQSCTVIVRSESERRKQVSVLNRMKAAVFDMDGTLVDSMQLWMHAAERYLKTKGICAEPGIWDATRTMDMRQTADYFRQKYNVSGSTDTIIEEINNFIYEQYAHVLQLKAGAVGLLAALAARDIPMVLATSTDRRCVDACISRLDIGKYFTGILTCSELGAGKDRPDIYIEAARLAGKENPAVSIRNTVVFEDALYAGRTAVEAGFPVCAVYDESALGPGGWLELRGLAACSCLSLADLCVSHPQAEEIPQ